jgi:AcrR family transcriptional regulator
VPAKAQPARPSREEVLTAYRRDVLLDAARRVFGARGFDEATVDAIAAEAKVAKGTVYLYFPSKLAIYEAAFAAGMDELTRLTDERVRAAASIRDAIRAFVEVRVAYFQAHPDYYRMYVHEVSRQLTDRTPRKSTCREAMLAHTRGLREAFTQAIAAGEVRAVDPAAAALAVFDLTRGFVARRLLARSRSDAAQEIGFLAQLIWTGLQPGPDTAGRNA